ncbi:type III effector, partial [Pseudidiomarina aestuarii]
MDLATFLSTLTDNPSAIDFEDTIAVIDTNYQFTPTA